MLKPPTVSIEGAMVATEAELEMCLLFVQCHYLWVDGIGSSEIRLFLHSVELTGSDQDVTLLVRSTVIF